MKNCNQQDYYIIKPSDAPSICDNSTTPYEYISENIWNKSISTPEFSGDLTLLHKDMEDIKTLICDIKKFLSDFFAEE